MADGVGEVRGETVGITDRGALVAVLAPPSGVGGTAALIVAGRVRRATRRLADLPDPVAAAAPTGEVLHNLRADG